MKEHRGPNVFAVSRALWDDPDFADEPMTEREAWVWLVGAAAWKDIRTRGNAGPVDLKRSEFSFSLRFLRDKFKWPKTSVERFLTKLEKRDTIVDTSRDGSKIYSINNYNFFQVVGAPKKEPDRDTNRDDAGTEAGHDRDGSGTKKKQGKQDNRITGEEDKKTPSAPTFVLLPPWLPEEPWNEYLRVRKGLRCADTPYAHQLLIDQLEKLRKTGHDPTEVIQRSIKSGWKDFFPIKPDNKNGTTRNGYDGHGTSNLIEGTRRALERAERETGGVGSDHDRAPDTGLS